MLTKGRRAPVGQTLLEAIVAITVLMIISIALAQLTVQALSIQRLVRERTVAVGLAAEAVEWARSIRDSNWLRNNPAVPWDSGLSSGTDYIATIGWDSAQRRFASTFSSLDAADIGTADSLLYRTVCAGSPGCVSDAYTGDPTGNTPTIFHRLVYLWPICMNLAGTLAEQAATESDISLEGQVCIAPKTKVGVAVRADVQYRDGRLYTVSAEERLYNWREGSPL
jgi:Tfp pilus assembly protein PilV